MFGSSMLFCIIVICDDVSAILALKAYRDKVHTCNYIGHVTLNEFSKYIQFHNLLEMAVVPRISSQEGGITNRLRVGWRW